MKESEVKGIKVCKIGERIYSNVFIEVDKGENHIVYEVKGNPQDILDEDSDLAYIKQGYIMVTPLHYDLTNFNLLTKISNIIVKENK